MKNVLVKYILNNFCYNFFMGFNNVILELRNFHNVSQKQVADAVGISQSTIAKIEIGRNEATASTIRKLADYFQVSADYLLERADNFEGVVFPTNSPTVPALSDEERQLLELFSRMDRAQKIKALGYCEGLISVKTGARYPNFKA